MEGSAHEQSRRRFDDDLVGLALKALAGMFDKQAALFSQKAHLRGDGYANLGANSQYTAMSLAGILRQTAVSPDSVVPVGRVLDRLHEIAAAGANPAVRGLVLWVSALSGDARGEQLLAGLTETQALERLDSATLGHMLHGLAQGAEAYSGRSGAAVDAGRRCAAELLSRFSARADLFAPISRPTGLRSAAGKRLTSFASQVYPLHGLASYYRLSGEAPDPALRRTAERLVAAQGSLGQWWWLYSTASRAVLEGYPVYSVHQDGMAYMALVPLEGLGQGSYGGPLALGLEWLYERNELSASLVGREPAFVCRNIQRVGSDADAPFGISRANLLKVVARSLPLAPKRDHVTAAPEELEVLRECRSYHLGWLLYASALVAE
jgi:hypothetical protein